MDPGSEEVSKVLHMRLIPFDATEEEVLSLVRPWGHAAHVYMRNKQQALVEMHDTNAAMGVVNYYSSAACAIRGCPVEVHYSKHQSLNRRPGSDDKLSVGNPNRILLVTIHDVVYPITVDIVHQVFSPHGSVEKIVIFSKTVGLQVLVQYQVLESAQHALQTLQGQHIYSGVCRLEIQYSKLQDLTITSNNENRRDFTNPHLPTEPPALLPTPADGKGGGGSTHHSIPGSPTHPSSSPHAAISPGYGFPPAYVNGGGYGAQMFLPQGGVPGQLEGCVLLVHNLHEDRTTCSTLFNLFSNYGNIIRIKRFYNKLDHALVEMQEPMHASSALQHLKGCVVFGKPLHVRMSKHRSINPGPNPYEEGDPFPPSSPPSSSSGQPNEESAQEPLCVGYANSKLNRYRGAAAAKALRNAFPPSSTVHLSNLASDTTEEILQEAFKDCGEILGTRMFESSDHLMCLMEFDTVETATDTLCVMHNQIVNGRHIRVAFSRKTVAA